MADSRIPLGFATASAGHPARCAWLIEGAAAAPEAGPVMRFGAAPAVRHPFGCACCTGRGAVAEALGRLFLARARGEVAWFERVLAVTGSSEGEAAIRTALRQDELVSARYRLEG